MFSGLCVHPPRKGQLLGSGSHFSVFLSSFLLHLSLLSAASISSSHPDYSHRFTNISSNKTFPGPMSPFSYHTNPLLLDSTILERTAFFIFFIAISNLSSFLLFFCNSIGIVLLSLSVAPSSKTQWLLCCPNLDISTAFYITGSIWKYSPGFSYPICCCFSVSLTGSFIFFCWNFGYYLDYLWMLPWSSHLDRYFLLWHLIYFCCF